MFIALACLFFQVHFFPYEQRKMKIDILTINTPQSLTTLKFSLGFMFYINTFFTKLQEQQEQTNLL